MTVNAERWDQTFRGRWAGCGFLGKMGEDPPRRIEAAISNDRVSGNLWTLTGSDKAQPHCVMGHDLVREIVTNLVARPDAKVPKPVSEVLEETRQLTKACLAADRKCPDWRRWDTNFGPLWNIEQQRREEEEDRRAVWEKSLRRENRLWQLASLVVAVVAVSITAAVTPLCTRESDRDRVVILATPSPTLTPTPTSPPTSSPTAVPPSATAAPLPSTVSP